MDRIKVMIQMRREGKTLQEIGDHYEISRERVRQLLQGTDVDGVRVVHGNYKTADARYQKVEQLWNEGNTAKEIAIKVGITSKVVWTLVYRMRKNGWNLPYRRADYRMEMHSAIRK